MIKRGQIFVRALLSGGRWVTIDALDLDDESFRLFVLGTLFRHGLLTGLRDEAVHSERLPLRPRPDFKLPDEAE